MIVQEKPEEITHYPDYVADLPTLTLPLTITRTEAKKYLGGRYLKGDLTISLSYFAKNDTEMKALYDFYNIACNSGTTPFTLDLNVFGIGTGKFVVEWMSDFISKRDKGIVKTGDLTFKIKYVVDDEQQLQEIENY